MWLRVRIIRMQRRVEEEEGIAAALEVGQENIRKERQFQYIHLTHNGRVYNTNR